MFRLIKVGASFAVLLAIAAAGQAQTNLLRLRQEGQNRSAQDAIVRREVGRLDRSLAAALRMPPRSRRSARAQAPVLMPVRVERRGLEVGKHEPGPLTLRFESTGSGAFNETDRTLLQDAFASAGPVLTTVFGTPIQGGDVWVVNADATLSDRESVIGGLYLPSIGGRREIRLRIYENREATLVNFVHTLALAYQGTRPYAFDAFQEGLARAVTAQVVRTSGALPTADAGQIDSVLDRSYEVGGLYDWNNQRALAAKEFIAPNLRDEPLPAGGSLGGLYLLRYRMAGNAWQKVLVEYPTFGAQLNERIRLDPSLAEDASRLIQAGTQIIQAQRPTDPTVEGLPFAAWIRRQWGLQTQDYNGAKLLLQATPIVDGLAGPDFGVFNIEANYFERLADGDEVLLSATAYPIFWDVPFLNRLIPSAQDERMDIAGAYGSVGPNFTDDFAGQPYRVTVDLPVAGRLARLHLPAGAVATAGRPTPNDFFGTVTGLPTGVSAYVQVSLGDTVLAEAPVTNDAFGVRIGTDAYSRARSLRVRVRRNDNDAVLLLRQVNKGPGDLALDLRIAETDGFRFDGGIRAGISLIGNPVEAEAVNMADALGVSPAALLLARYNPARARYDLFPDIDPGESGLAYFVRSATTRAVELAGRSLRIPTSVATRPGWNQVAVPFDEAVSVNSLLVVSGPGAPLTWNEAAGEEVGRDIFEFVPGPNDAGSGVPETGTYRAVTDLVPGRGYFVRSLSSFGASLLFSPENRSRSRPNRSRTAPNRGWRPSWEGRITAQGPGVRAEAWLSLVRGGSAGYRASEDSDLPPSVGGFQVSSRVGRALYRDVRGLGANEFRLDLAGLRPGRTYRLTLNTVTGKAARLRLVDRARGVNLLWREQGTYSFTARKSDESLTLLAEVWR